MTTFMRMLRHLGDGEAYSVPEIAADLNLSAGRVRQEMKELVATGVAAPAGTSKTGARCFLITAHGREAIAAAHAEARS